MDHSIPKLFKELEVVQKNLMANLKDNLLWMQDKSIQDKIQQYALEQDISLTSTPKVDSIWR